MAAQALNVCESKGRLNEEAGWDPEWRALHRRLCAYAKHRSALDAAEAFDLVRAEQFKLYAFHACATHYEYMERILGYGPHAARERMRVARALVGLPETTAALARGELSYSGVRELTRVMTDETESAWLARAKGLAVNQIERLVANHQRGDRPDDRPRPDLRPRVVRLELPPEVYALWRQARMVVWEERGCEMSEADFVETMCRAIISPGSGAGAPAHQIAYQQCPDCRRTTQNGAGREIDVAPEVFERASCDARELGSLDSAAPERATSTVTPRVREQVFARDHHRCTVPGCRSARNLDIHHIEFQSHGGSHEISNLTLLCSGHHAALHNGLLTMTGKAPYEIAFQWTYGPPIPLGLTPSARDEMLARNIERIFESITGPAAEQGPCEGQIRPTRDPRCIDPVVEPTVSPTGDPRCTDLAAGSGAGSTRYTRRIDLPDSSASPTRDARRIDLPDSNARSTRDDRGIDLPD